MEKISCLLLAIVISIPLTSQKQLTNERNAYRASDQLIKQQVEFKDPGSSGKNLIWDFRMLQPVNEEYPLEHFIPDSTRMDTICGMEHFITGT